MKRELNIEYSKRILSIKIIEIERFNFRFDNIYILVFKK